MLSVLTLAGFLIIYAVVHSLLAGLPCKNWARRVFGPGVDRWYRLGFNILAVITFLPFFALMALLPDRILYIVPSPWRWLMVTGQVLALAGLAMSFQHTNLWQFLGLSQLLVAHRAESGKLVVQGFYCRVRHPLYTFSLLFLWLTPAMSVNLFTAYLLFALYFYVGSIYEERRLLVEFGQSYRDYQQAVPRLIPRPGRCYEPTAKN